MLWLSSFVAMAATIMRYSCEKYGTLCANRIETLE